MKLSILAVLSLVLVVGITPVKAGAPDKEHETKGDLVRIHTQFKNTWVHPSAELGRYTKIMLGESSFEFRDVGDAHASRSGYRANSGKSEFTVKPADREKFKRVVSEAFRRELERSTVFQLVDSAGPDTLLVRGAVLDIVSHVPPETIGRSDIYLSSVGEATLTLQLLDSESETVLAYVEDRRKLEQPGGGRIDATTLPANSATVWADVGRWARQAAARLRVELEKTREKTLERG